jgi:protein O-mannosyl-transferase
MLHPIHTEAVMGISHRKEMLAFSFLLLAFHAYLFRNKRPAIAYIASTVFFILAVLSKQVALVFPLILVFYELQKSKWKFSQKRTIFAGVLIFFSALLLGGGILFSSSIFGDFNLFGRISTGDLEGIGYGETLSTSFTYYPKHIQFILFPVHMTPLPDIQLTNWDTLAPFSGLFLFFSMISLVYYFRNNFIVGFSLAWIFINLLPIMNWVPANAFFAERYLYIPSAGFCLLLSGAVIRLYSSQVKIFNQFGYRALGILLSIILFTAIIIEPFALRMNTLWSSKYIFMMDSPLAIMISAISFGIFGAMIFEISRTIKISSFFQKHPWINFLLYFVLITILFAGPIITIEYLLNNRVGFPLADADYDLANLNNFLSTYAEPGPRASKSFFFLSGTGKIETANFIFFTLSMPAILIFFLLRILKKNESENPNSALVIQMVFVIIFTMAGQTSIKGSLWASEVKLWQSSVIENPDSAMGWNNLGKAYLARKKNNLAIKPFEKAVKIDPKLAGAYKNIGIAYIGMGNLEKAKPAFQEAIRLNRVDLDSRNNLANIIFIEAWKTNDNEKYNLAISQYQDILKLNRMAPFARYNIAYCYYKIGAYEKARIKAFEALNYDPNNEKIKTLIDLIYKAQ